MRFVGEYLPTGFIIHPNKLRIDALLILNKINLLESSIKKWNKQHSILMLVASVLSYAQNSLLIVAVFGLGSFAYYIYENKLFLSTQTPFAGYANIITALRLLILVSTFCWIPNIPIPILVGLLVIVLLLDLLDGYLARKFKQDSKFGQYFDMEVDALFVLGMCFYFFQNRNIDAWILIPGIMRYVYKVITMIFPKKDYEETKKSYATTIAGMYFIVLIVSLILPNIFLFYLLAIGSGLIVLSFFISFYEYFTYQDQLRQ